MWVKVKLVFLAWIVALSVSRVVAMTTTPGPDDNITDLRPQGEGEGQAAEEEAVGVGVEEGLGEPIIGVQGTTGGEESTGSRSNAVNTIADVRNVGDQVGVLSNRAASDQSPPPPPPDPDEDMLSPEILVMSSDGDDTVPEGAEFTPIPLETVTTSSDLQVSGREPLIDDLGGISAAEVESYFQKYNYLGENMPDKSIARLADTNMTAAIIMATQIFQQKYGLDVTGELDPKTISLIQMPRCGVPDLITMEDMSRRKKRYTLFGGKWDKDEVTYQITRYPQDGDLSPKQVDRAVRQAFRVWQEASALSFKRLDESDSGKPDIEIMFTDRVHGDGFPFDGPSGTLAHAFYPAYGGTTHFDDAELWTVNTNSGINLFQVAAHEFGHALGLAHSSDISALMAPFYAGYIPDFTLPTDDIKGIQAKYGARSTDDDDDDDDETTEEGTDEEEDGDDVMTTAAPLMPPDMEDICEKAMFDAITIIRDGEEDKTYAFKGMQFYLIDSNGGIADGHPRKIQDQWSGLPSDIDAALFRDGVYDYNYVKEGRRWKLIKTVIFPPATYIFKGNQYWKIEDMRLLESYPRPISDWGLNTSIDAAFVWNYNGQVYFIKDDKYYRYEETEQRTGIVSGYPRPLSNWRGLPSRVDAAFKWDNDIVYFFNMGQYFAFNDETFRVDNDYPRNTDGFWLRCYRYQSKNTELEDQDDTSLASSTHIPSMLSLLTSCLIVILISLV